MYQCMAMGLVCLFCPNIWLSAFMALNVILFARNGGTVGFETVVNIFIGIMLYMASLRFFSETKFSKCYKPILWVGFVSIVFMITQVLGIDPLHFFYDTASNGMRLDRSFTDPVGIFGLKAHEGIFYSLMIPIFAASVNSLWLIPACLTLWLITICKSTAAIFGAIISLLFFCWFKRRKAFWIILPISLIGGLFYSYKSDYKDDPQMFCSRFNTWHMAVRQSLEQPFGYGPDSWRNLTPFKNFMFMGDEKNRAIIAVHVKDDKYKPIYYDMNTAKMQELMKVDPSEHNPNFWDDPHNEFIKGLFFYGFFGLFLIGGFLKGLWTKFKSCSQSTEACVIASLIIVFLISSTTQFPLSVARLGYLFPVLIGALEAQ